MENVSSPLKLRVICNQIPPPFPFVSRFLTRPLRQGCRWSSRAGRNGDSTLFLPFLSIYAPDIFSFILFNVWTFLLRHKRHRFRHTFSINLSAPFSIRRLRVMILPRRSITLSSGSWRLGQPEVSAPRRTIFPFKPAVAARRRRLITP